MRTLAVIGALAVCAAILTLFFSIGRRSQRLTATMAPPVDSPEFLLAVSGTAGVPLREGGSARLLNNGKDFFPALMGAIREAKRTVDFTCYIWESGRVSDQVTAALIDRARAGVAVRVLLDGFGSATAPKDGMDALRAAGARVETFRAPRLGKLTRFHRRNHRRAIVIDGVTAFTGGMAVGDKWLGDADSDDHWRDTMVEVTGPLAATLQSAFAQLWTGTTGEILVGSRFFPPPDPSAPPTSAATVHVGVASSPFGENQPLRFFFAQTFLSATRRLYLSTSYFVPDEATRDAVAERARAGVDVRILLPDEHTDAKLIRLTSQAYYEDLLKAGVRIYEYQRTMMHVKGLVVDGKWSVVGSANMDIRGDELNEENVLGILDEGFAREMEEAFARDLRDSREIRLEEWRRRGPWQRLREGVATLFAEQY